MTKSKRLSAKALSFIALVVLAAVGGVGLSSLTHRGSASTGVVTSRQVVSQWSPQDGFGPHHGYGHDFDDGEQDTPSTSESF